MPSDTTVPSLPADPSATGGTGANEAVPTVILAFSDAHPDRAAESYPFPDLHLEHFFGRGPGDGHELRVELAPRTPIFTGQPVPFDDANLSRRLFEITARPLGFDVAKRAPCTLRLAGVETPQAGFVPFGETIRIDDRLLFYTALRPRRLDLRSFPWATRGRFGVIDRYKIIGESWALYVALDDLAFAARTIEHVLLHGDSGTGKELFAQALHALSTRARRAFLARNAAGIPPGLVESELCGIVAGYPQGGSPGRIGMLEAVDGGTLFLDEIGEIAHALQAMLLRVLDAGGEYWRIGESKARHTDLRMVLATNRRIDSLKSDLVPRVKQIVELPPLRARLEDVPLLVPAIALRKLDEIAAEGDATFRDRFVETSPDGARRVRISIDFIDALLVSDHPNNVRGLDAIVLSSIKKSRGSRLRPYPGLWENTRRHARANRTPLVGPGGRVRDLSEGEVANLRDLVAEGHGGKSRAARALGLSRHQVKRLLERYGIGAPDDPDGGEESDDGK
jgi:DNA-binding NtrC family response regulator